MTTSSIDLAAYTAANRFGYGLRPGELATVSKDPRAWLRSQLDAIATIPAAYSEMDSSQTALTAEAEWRAQRRQANRDNQDPQELQRLQREYRRKSGQQRQQQMALRMQVAVETEQPFAERLVRFWSNHFTVAVSGGAKAVLNTIAVPYENEAIRANLKGDFGSLLLAVEQHPAMLIYLDNNLSIGPNSVVGRRRGAGLNENLAREILELHSLGVDGGYSQADVTNLARIITGWSVQLQAGNGPVLGRLQPGRFNFVPIMHEPGSQKLLGKNYGDQGVAQGEQALADIAQHPATARHIATKLVRHFVADVPPAAAVARIEKAFLETDGNLPAVHGALLELEQAWDPAYRKLKTPEELLVSSARALNMTGSSPGAERVFAGLSGTLAGLNQIPFSASSPAGWADSAEHWGSPDALLKRIEWANEIAERTANRIDPASLYPQIMPPRNDLQKALSRAESSSQGLALLLASPQFQWR